MNKPSGRFSRYPAVNRDVPGHGATYPERVAGTAPKPATAPETAPVQSEVDVDSMTVAEVLAWVGDDPARAAVAITAERAGRNRRGIVDAFN